MATSNEKASTSLDRAPTSYEIIKGYSNNLKSYIAEHGIPLGLGQFPYEIIMDIDRDEKKGLGRLLADLDCKKIICVLGLGDGKAGFPELKISFLGIDAEGNVDRRHKEGAKLIDGEETWPPGDTITNPNIELP